MTDPSPFSPTGQLTFQYCFVLHLDVINNTRLMPTGIGVWWWQRPKVTRFISCPVKVWSSPLARLFGLWWSFNGEWVHCESGRQLSGGHQQAPAPDTKELSGGHQCTRREPATKRQRVTRQAPGTDHLLLNTKKLLGVTNHTGSSCQAPVSWQAKEVKSRKKEKS